MNRKRREEKKKRREGDLEEKNALKIKFKVKSILYLCFGSINIFQNFKM